jgi:hypothetical protein
MTFTDHAYLQLLHEQSQSTTSQLLKLLKFSSRNSPIAPESELPVIPDPSVFSSLTVEERGDEGAPSSPPIDDIPTIGECAAHLELLEAFLVLKTKVLNSGALDRTFGIPATKFKKDGLGRIREKKWLGFVGLAVIRFQKWWQNIDKVLLVVGEGAAEFTAMALPPLGKESCYEICFIV